MSKELPFSIKKAIRRYEKIDFEGLFVWPVLVKEYDEFLVARPALEVLHQSLPVAMMRIPLLSAYYRMDYEARRNGEPMVGLFSRALLGLALSLRLGEGLPIDERVRIFQIEADREDGAKLVRLRFMDSGGEVHEILPQQYAELRKIIAAQNGVRLESDEANPDIVNAQKKMGSGGVALDVSADALISSVAALSHADEKDIDEWPILKLEKRAQTYLRFMQYLVNGVGEMSGATWKGGNPVPHPYFERTDNGRAPMSPLKSGKGQGNAKPGVVTIENQIKAHTKGVN